LIARIDIRQEIQKEERLLFNAPTQGEAIAAWERLAELLKRHDQLEARARTIKVDLTFTEYLDDVILH
jgi:iron-sulfur cluster repair protein YtfE (RIC family)